MHWNELRGVFVPWEWALVESEKLTAVRGCRERRLAFGERGYFHKSNIRNKRLGGVLWSRSLAVLQSSTRLTK